MTPHAFALRIRRADRALRAQLWGRIHPGIDIGHGVQIGRRCRLFVEPRARLVIGDGCEIDDGTTLAVYGDGVLAIGAGVFIGHTCTIASRSRVAIGTGTFLAELVSIRDHDHSIEQGPSSHEMAVEPVEIGSGVWIAAKATVLKGAVIGDGAVVGAHAVARGEIPPWTVNVGIPARVVRTYDPASTHAAADGGAR